MAFARVSDQTHGKYMWVVGNVGTWSCTATPRTSSWPDVELNTDIFVSASWTTLDIPTRPS